MRATIWQVTVKVILLVKISLSEGPCPICNVRRDCSVMYYEYFKVVDILHVFIFILPFLILLILKDKNKEIARFCKILTVSYAPHLYTTAFKVNTPVRLGDNIPYRILLLGIRLGPYWWEATESTSYWWFVGKYLMSSHKDWLSF